MHHSASETKVNQSIQFFDVQFRKQLAQQELSLNPFEQAILPFVKGKMLDLGCGLGNLSIAAAQCGYPVLALDGCASAVAALNERAGRLGLPVRARVANLADAAVAGRFDTVACVGLLMFFPPVQAFGWLNRIKELTCPGGVAAVNVLIEGTTYLEMFNPAGYTLFGQDALHDAFADWQVLHSAVEQFDAPGNTVKRFSTVVARRPGGG